MSGENGRGVVKVGDVLYYTEASSRINAVYGYNLVTNKDLGAVFSVAGASAGLATMAYDGTNFYLGDYSGTNNAYKYSITGALLGTIPLSLCTSYCDGLEYAQGHLVSNEADGGGVSSSAYDVYTTSGGLLTKHFITTDFGATGISFDGQNYWVPIFLAALCMNMTPALSRLASPLFKAQHISLKISRSTTAR